MIRPPTILLILLPGLVSCARSLESAASSPDGEGYRSMDAESSAEGPQAAPAMAWDEDQFDARKKKDAPDDASAVLGSVKPTSTAPSSPETTPADEPPPSASDRYLVYTAEMTLSVFDLESARDAAERLPDRFGGYLSQLSDEFIVLRLPSENLRPAMSDLATLGIVESRRLNAQEVTAEFVDLESRIRALRETQLQLLDLLSKARSVDEALQVRAALDDINTQLEVLQGRMRQLSNQIAFSTLTLRLIERGPHDAIPSSNDPFPWVDRLGVEATEWK